MATTEEKQELIDTIKGPKHYRITIWGYGGESAYLKLTKEQYEFWKAKDAEEYDTTLQYMVDVEDNGKPEWVPDEMDFMAYTNEDGSKYYNSWYDTPNEVLHQWGTAADGARVTIDEVESEEYNSKVIKTVFESNNIKEWGDQIAEDSDWEIEPIEYGGEVDAEVPNYVLQFYSSEKGTFFDGQFSTVGPIDLNKLKFHTKEYWNEEDTIESVSYDGEEIENSGGDTNGKGYSVHMWTFNI